MNYIQQAYKSKLELWKYLVYGGLFFGFMGLNFIGLIILENLDPNFDIEQLMKDQIAAKGASRFLIENLVPFAIGLATLLVWVKFIHKQTITALTTSRPKIDWKRIFFAFFLWGFITVFFLVLDYKMSPENYQWNFKLVPFLILCVIAVIMVPLQTSFEEYLFRGYLMQGIGVLAKNKWLPLLITSLVFGLLHIANPEVEKLGYVIMIYYIGTGLFLGIVTLMDEGMEIALGFHAANNLFTALLLTADWTAFQTHSILKDMSDPSEMGLAEIFVPVFVIFPILLFILSRKYKWTNWKDRLFGQVVLPPKEDYKILEDIGTNN